MSSNEQKSAAIPTLRTCGPLNVGTCFHFCFVYVTYFMIHDSTYVNTQRPIPEQEDVVELLGAAGV